MCDIRFAAAGAKITTAFARRGLVAEQGISWLLPRVVGAFTVRSGRFPWTRSGRGFDIESTIQDAAGQKQTG